NPRKANALLISSSLVIDLLGFYLLGSAIFGSTIQPFLGLLMLFALRQLCQAFCPLPPPGGMIWRDPGFPTILVTYGTSTDLFFRNSCELTAGSLYSRGSFVKGALDVLGPGWSAQNQHCFDLLRRTGRRYGTHLLRR